MSEWEQAIVDRIKKSMKKRGVTQMELAETLGVRQYTVSRMLSGNPFPGVEQLRLIAERLDVSLYYLLGVQEESYRELSSKAARIANAYEDASEAIQAVIERVLLVS